ncbi:hypothetical protein TNCV_1266191 [Trichonephila clavipes]|nr:hypothetical protein TNCV_1266191 [Trichonephila clavipes]
MRLRHWAVLNSRRDASFLVRLVEREEKCEVPNHLQGALPQNWGGTESNRTGTCMMLKATVSDKNTSSPLPR